VNGGWLSGWGGGGRASGRAKSGRWNGTAEEGAGKGRGESAGRRNRLGRDGREEPLIAIQHSHLTTASLAWRRAALAPSLPQTISPRRLLERQNT